LDTVVAGVACNWFLQGIVKDFMGFREDVDLKFINNQNSTHDFTVVSTWFKETDTGEPVLMFISNI